MSAFGRGIAFGLGVLVGSWLSSPDALRELGGWASGLAGEVEKWEDRRDRRLAKMIASELKAADEH